MNDNNSPDIRSNNYNLKPLLDKNDRTAKLLIWIASVVVFIVVALLAKIKLNINLGFNPHVFALINAMVNSLVTLCLLMGLFTVKNKNYRLHKRIMLIAIGLSFLFLLSYIAHHLFAGETKFGDTDHNGIVSPDEKLYAGEFRYVYYVLLATHIPLAAIILPFILFTAYRSLTGEYQKHKKLARITFPIWLYVSVTGVIIYWMIRPYYN
ncbi:DUF420 domain-containing protein [soil metagenome]